MFVNIPDEIKRDINDFFEIEFVPALIGHIQPNVNVYELLHASDVSYQDSKS